MKRPVNTVTIIPQRISADHYRLDSFTRSAKTYDLVYNYELRKWICSCPDTKWNRNPRCKHLQLLLTWIAAQEQQQLAQRQATQIAASLEPSPLESALSEALQRIAALENQTAQRDAEIEELHTRLAFQQGAEQELHTTQKEISTLRKALQMQRNQLADHDETIHVLQSQQCKTNEHRFALAAELERARIEINGLTQFLQQQAQINDELLRQIETFNAQVRELQQITEQRAAQPSIEIKINGKSVKPTGTTSAAKRTRATKQPKLPSPAQRIQEVRRDGRLTALKIDGATIKVVEGCIVGQCNCKNAQKGTVCLHEQEAWTILKKM